MGAILKRRNIIASLIRKLLLAWLTAVTVEFLLLSSEHQQLNNLTGIAQMSLFRVLAVTAVMWLFLCAISLFLRTGITERWMIVTVFAVLMTVCLISSFSWAFLTVCCLILLALVFYAASGWDDTPKPRPTPVKENKCYVWITLGISLLFFLFVSIWTACKVFSFCTPTFDFGIFSQMFHSMKTTGLPMTTVERDGPLSHFSVHVSPIYYLLLPFYWIAPYPATLQVLQAAVITSAVIPLWKLGRHHGLSPLLRTLMCALLLLYPAFSGGTSYDIHENAFLTPLILWLLYGIDKKNTIITCLAGFLTCMVKEDAAVYVAIAGLYLLLRTLLRKEGKWGIFLSVILLAGSIQWFFAVTGYLAESGDGVMTYRYENFMYDGSTSLITVIKSVILCPMKAVYECVDKEKLTFILQTMLPLLGLPLLTRRYERYILLIPYILINLMSDYQYQHNILFQYTFGSIAFLFYLTLVNLSDIRLNDRKLISLGAAIVVSAVMFCDLIVPTAYTYSKYAIEYKGYYDQVRQTLDLIPEDASVSASTFYTTYLSQRDVLYDVRYCSREHLLSTEYVALAVGSDSSYTPFEKNGKNGFENLVALLEKNGYEKFAEMGTTLVIYKSSKTQ